MTTETSDLLDPVRLVADGGPLRLVIKAALAPVGGVERFQPAGFPEIGHVIYQAPRADGTSEPVCIVDSAASMANHLEMVCQRGAHDPDLVPELQGLPHLRCVTDQGWPEVRQSVLDGGAAEVVVTSLTEGHRIASTYFLGGRRLRGRQLAERVFEEELQEECGILPLGKKKAHPSPSAWWTVFATIFRYDPNALVHGVLLPQWQVKISRALTAHLEALGAARVDRSGVKFDRLGKTTSGQPIFAVDDETAREIRATFVVDLALIRSFGRRDDGTDRGLKSEQKALLAALSLWKIGRLVSGAFRYRTACDLACERLELMADQAEAVEVPPSALGDVDIRSAIEAVDFAEPAVTDLYWPAGELYRKGQDGGDDE